MTDPAKRPQTKAAQNARAQLIWDLTYLRRDRLIGADIRDEVPEAWHTLEADIPAEETKEKVTLYLDRSVARSTRRGQGLSGADQSASEDMGADEDRRGSAARCGA